MKIYTGMASGKKLENVDKYGLGFMISSTPDRLPGKECIGRPCALDNGAYLSYMRGYPFLESYFWRAMSKCYELKLKLDFIVVPDIVGGGEASFDFSLNWLNKLIGGSLAFVIQSGTPIKHMEDIWPLPISTIFIGGSHLWDWSKVAEWREWAKEKGLVFHIGRIGNLNDLHKAKAVGADSVDSTNFTRNECWNVLDDFRDGPSPCPSCGKVPTINAKGMLDHYECSGFMIGSFMPKVWERHCKSGNML